MDDNPYIIELNPQEFMELWEIISYELDWSDRQVSPKDYQMVKRIFKKLKQADKKHICKDDQE